MFDIIRNYLVLNKNIPLKLPFMWRIFYQFFLLNMKYTLIFSTEFINIVFEQAWFKKLFRNKNYEND